MLLTQQTIIIAAASQDAFVGFSVSLHLSYKKWLFFVLSSAYLVVFIQNVAITVVTPDVMQDLGLSSGDMGLLGSVYLYAYALTQVFSGILSTRFGPRRLLSCQFLVAALGGFLFATAHSLPMAVAGRLLNGLGMAGVMSSSFTLFSRWFAPETFSRLCTLFFIAGGMGGLLATTPLSLANHWVGWRLVFLALSVLTCSLTVIIYTVVRDWPPHLAATCSGIRLADVLRDVAAMARQSDFWKMVVWYLTLPSQYFVFHGLWGAVYMGGTFGLSPSLIGNILAMGAVGFIAGTPLLTWISEKRLKSRRKAMVLASLLACVSGAALSLGSAGLSVPLLFVVSLGLGIAANGPCPVGYATGRERFGNRMVGSLSGILASSVFVGGALLQLISGALLSFAQQAGLSQPWTWAFAPLVLLAAVSALAAWLLPETFVDKK